MKDPKDDLIRELEDKNQNLLLEIERLKKPKFKASNEEVDEAIKELTRS